MTEKTLTVTADLSESSKVRDTAAAFFSESGFEKIWTNRLIIVVDELFANAVKYGSKKGDEVKIEMQFDGKEICFSVADSGAAAISVAELRKKIEDNAAGHTPHKTGGRGLAVITHRWTDEYDIRQLEDGGFCIGFRKKIEADPEKPVVKTISTTPRALALAGEIDESTIEEVSNPVKEFLSKSDEKELILDMSEVTFINSACIGRIASWHSEMQSRDGFLKIQNPQPQVREIIELVGLDNIIEVN